MTKKRFKRYVISMSIRLIPKIKQISKDTPYKKEWLLVQTFPKAFTEINCLCGSITKYYRLYFNIENGNLFRLGLDCRQNHLESIAELSLPEQQNNGLNTPQKNSSEKDDDQLLRKFLQEISRHLRNFDNITKWIQGTRSAESLIIGALNVVLESLGENNGDEKILQEILFVLRNLQKVITLEKYHSIFDSKIHLLNFKSALNQIEPSEYQERQQILNEYTDGYLQFNKEFEQVKNVEEMKLAEKYLASLPSIVSENLKKTYPLPGDLWQLQQTNGFKKYLSGQFPNLD